MVVSGFPLCLGVLNHRAPLAMAGGGGGGESSCQTFFTMDFSLCGAILNLKALCLLFPNFLGKCMPGCLCRSTKAQVRGAS